MRLERLQLENWRSYDDLDLDLTSITCAAIVGRNGAGKSSIVMAPDICLYGGPMDDLLREGTTKGHVCLTFSLERKRYKVTRGRERNKKSWLHVETFHHDGTGWEPVNTHTIRETQAWLDRELGLTAEAFSASVYSPQGEAGLLAAMTAGDRKALLGGLLGLDCYEDWRATATADAREVAGTASALQQRLEAAVIAHGEAQSQAAELEDIRASIVVIEAELASTDRLLGQAVLRQEAASKVALRAQLVQQMKDCKARAQSVVQQGKDLEAATKLAQGIEKLRSAVTFERDRANAAEAELASWDGRRRAAVAGYDQAKIALQALLDRIAELEHEADTVEATRTEVARKIGALDEPGALCPTCGQSVEGKAHAHAQEELRKENRELRRRLVAAGQAAVPLQAGLDPARELVSTAEQEFADVGERPAQHDMTSLRAVEATLRDAEAAQSRAEALAGTLEREEGVEALKERYGDLQRRAKELPEAVPEGPSVDEVRQQEAGARRRLEEEGRRLASVQEAASRAATLKAECEELRGELAGHEQRVAVLEVLARAFSRDGIPALILDGAVAGIEDAANEVLQNLGSAFQLRLATQRGLKSGGTAETLDIVVDDGFTERELSTFSGGERFRVNIALRLGLARALGGRTFDCLLIDEVTDLDTDGVQALAATLTSLTDKQVLVVSHDSSLADSLPQRIQVSRRSDASPSEVSVA